MKLNLFMKFQTLLYSVLIILFFTSCTTMQKAGVQVKGENITIDFNKILYSRIIARIDGKMTILGGYSPSETVVISGKEFSDFAFTEASKQQINDNIGTGTRYIIKGMDSVLTKEISIVMYDDFPGMAIYQVTYTNTGDAEITIENWTNNHYLISANADTEEPKFWSYQSGSYERRPDWVLPLKQGFKQQNYMGMNASDYGGGTPVSDVWRNDVGLAVGHVEMVPKLVSIPITMPTSDQATLGLSCETNKKLKPGESFTTLKTFVAVHTGDYFQSLSEYRRFMVKQDIEFKVPPQTVYEPIWCAWGYQRNFTMNQIYGTLPMVKRLGYEWVVLDDGYQTAEGDWYLLKDKFPNGDRDMKKLTDKIHAEGLKAKLWWAPLAVDPGTDLIKQHPDYLLLNQDGTTQDISWWNSYYLCPAYPAVQEYTKNLVIKFMKTWGFDGLKIDGQHLNAAPPCYNKAHNHAYPEESFEKVPEFFKVIYETALNINPDAVVEICPCGTSYAFHTMPYMNQPVASDPESSWQIRLKGKTLKALMGPSTAYYGDHVELSDNRDDFASTVGIGGVIGTKFTWPVGAKKNSKIDLTPEKEAEWDKWIKIYRMKMLPTGTYLGSLYDIGFDRPEAHAVQKDDRMYYAFYADNWDGKVELRGLEKKAYKIYDYVDNKDYGTVTGPIAKIDVAFNKHLLLEAVPSE
ncbi:alpha-galactosidase [candidate division KSB1 bacterium]|nr:alpha-galactosidase [candidate division KSB1 bacterium]